MSRSRHDPATRARALALYREHGAAEASRILGGDPSDMLIRTWASRAGATLQRAKATEAATHAHVATMEERRTRLADRLLELAEMSAEQAGPLIAKASLRELVGAWDYAIKNSQLLSGEATARTEHNSEPVHAVIDEVAARRNRSAA